MTIRPAAFGAACLGLLLVLGCSSPATVEVGPQPLVLKKRGQTLKLDVTVKDRAGQLLTDVRPTFSALTPEIISVDSAGLVVALRSGDGAVLVSAGDVSETAKVSVRIAKRIDIEPSNPVLNLGVSTDLRATVRDDRGDPMVSAQPIRWSVSDPSVVALDAEGTIKTLAEGRATVTAYLEDVRGSTVITVRHEKYDEKEGTWQQ